MYRPVDMSSRPFFFFFYGVGRDGGGGRLRVVENSTLPCAVSPLIQRQVLLDFPVMQPFSLPVCDVLCP
jgi:hypothetical protein